MLKDGTAPIYIRVTVNKVSSEFATGKSINPSQWIAVKGRVKGNTLLNKQLNTFLDQQEYALHDIALQIQQYGKPVTAKEIARKYKGKDTPQISLVSLYEEHNKMQQELVGISVAKNTYKRHETSLKLFQEFPDLLRETVLLFQSYNMGNHLQMMSALQNSFMSESAFAQFLGKSRMYQFLPQKVKKSLPQMLMTDTQIGLVARAYYNDENFAPQQGAKEISMWNVYNLLTGANKSSYIDYFLDRSHNASLLADGLNRALYGENEYSWFIL